MVAEGLIRVSEQPQDERMPPIASRQADSGADVIDLRAMIRDSQAAQRHAHG